MFVSLVVVTAIVATHTAIETQKALESRSDDYADKDNWPWYQENIGPTQPPPDPEEEKRKRKEEECFTRCEGLLGGDPCSQGFPFTNCMKDCMSEGGFSYP